MFEERQPDNQKATVEITDNYKPLQQESTCKQQIQSIPISGYMQSKRGSSQSQWFHVYWNWDYAIIGSTEHDKGSIQMSDDYHSSEKFPKLINIDTLIYRFQ